ncbi:hypothetical protein EUX98_g3776 [Antrodiella citrinella]|uniref:Protein kinase domain-containing protein n=1 Tax=Antrodiella citrinella TaxID=2447956 RepID=A0A4S4MY61_9APHY|nr:hypothetical protein EUX98_g3776 [Antrodiella citrinella]
MDYLRNLGSAAVSSLVQKSGLTLPFSLGPKVVYFENKSIWTLYDATKREDGSPVSVFEFDSSLPKNRNCMPIAKNALRKLRTIRHPDVLKFLDAVETDSTICIMTERVRPLAPAIQERVSKTAQEREDWLLWGLHRIAVALTFINDNCASTHGNVRVDSVFISPSGEWKLGGFEVLSNPKDDAAVLYARLTAKGLLELGMAETAGEGSGFFATNRLVRVCTGLDNFNLASESEKAILLRTLKESAASLPTEFASYRVLPALASALEFGGASAAAILPLVLQLGRNVAPQDYGSVIMVHLVKLFASPDRGTRMALLDHLSEYADKLDKRMVVDKIWPNLVSACPNINTLEYSLNFYKQTGFTDTVPIIREATVKAIILFSDKLNERILNNDLLRYLARMQADQEASIRTNTCILLGRLGPNLGYNTKRKVLVPAFTKALKDSFVHCRVAGLMALMATVDCFDIDEIASRVIPNMSFTMIDPEKLVRDQAFKAMQLFVKKLEDHAATMPETSITEGVTGVAAVLATQQNGSTTLVNSAAGAAGALAGWAITSLGRSLATADLQSTISPTGIPASSAPNSAPVSAANGLSGGVSSRPSPLAHTLSSPGPGASTKPLGSTSKGMQLGAHKTPASATMHDMAMGWAKEAAAEVDTSGSNPWGTDDLMDVNADEDDWSAFESAPPAPVIGLHPTQVRNEPEADADHWGEGLAEPQNGSSFSHAYDPPPPKSPPTQHRKQTTTTLSTVATSIHRPASAQSDGWSDPVPSRGASPAQTPVTSTVGMSKEEKAAEMTRRKEERKQRIAALKEQKKNASAK